VIVSPLPQRGRGDMGEGWIGVEAMDCYHIANPQHGRRDAAPSPERSIAEASVETRLWRVGDRTTMVA